MNTMLQHCAVKFPPKATDPFLIMTVTKITLSTQCNAFSQYKCLVHFLVLLSGERSTLTSLHITNIIQEHHLYRHHITGALKIQSPIFFHLLMDVICLQTIHSFLCRDQLLKKNIIAPVSKTLYQATAKGKEYNKGEWTCLIHLAEGLSLTRAESDQPRRSNGHLRGKKMC